MMNRFTAEWINGFQLRDVFGIGPSNICDAVCDGFIRTAEVPKSNGGMAIIYNANDIRRYLNQLANHEIDYVSSNDGEARA